MKRGAWWCRFCLLGGVVCLLLAGVLLALRAGVAARVGQALAPRVAFAEALVARTQTFHLIPDNSAALAASHFAQAQTARAATNLAYAQIELEKALAFGELALNRRGADTYAGVALLREYYADYIDVLLQRNQQEPDGVFAKRAWEAHDRLRWLLSPRPAEAANAVNRTLTVAEVQQELLDDQSLLLEYALGEKQSYLWAITKIGFACFPLPPRTEIEAKAARLVELAGQQPEQMADDPNVEFERLAGELSAVLLQPVAAQMELRRVWVVPEGVLQQVPFSALPVPSQSLENDERLASTPLLVRHEVLNLPAAATGVWLRQQHQAPAQREAVGGDVHVEVRLAQAGQFRGDHVGVLGFDDIDGRRPALAACARAFDLAFAERHQHLELVPPHDGHASTGASGGAAAPEPSCRSGTERPDGPPVVDSGEELC